MKKTASKLKRYLILPAALSVFLLAAFSLPGTGYGERAGDVSYSREGMEKVYQRGITAFKNGEYDSALFWFDVFLDAFPDSDLADNALYWAGETYYTKKDYSAAAAAFSEVLKRFPKGNKAPAAMLKLSLCQLELGNRAEAIRYLKSVLTEYPDTEAARIAQKRLKDFQAER